MECLVEVSSKINPTEDAEKVKKSVQNIFPKGKIIMESEYVLLSGERELLVHFKEVLEKRKIRTVARSIMEKRIDGNKVKFYVSKQAALVNVINFSEDNSAPLEDIKIEIESENLEEVLKWLAPIEEILE
jgi:predicted RNA binding protein with dsRBD fold (UPF0201 family)